MIRDQFTNDPMADPNLPKRGFKSDLVIDRAPRPEDRPQSKFITTTATVSPDAAHTYGNVICGLQQYLLGLFPPHTFRSTFISTSVPKRQLRSTPVQLMKNSPPMLVMTPRIDYGQDGGRAFGGTMMFERLNDFKYQYEDDTMQPFLHDNTCDFKCEWTMNRWVINVDCMMVFNTLPEQINYMNYFQNRTRIDHPFLVAMPLESVIPKSMISLISKVSNVPVYDKSGGVSNFIRYLQSISVDPITYKMKSSTQNDEFFRYFRAEVLTRFSAPEVNDGMRDGHITRLYEIMFTARMEFNGVGMYCISSPHIRSDHTIMLPSDPPPAKKNQAIVTMFTDEINYRKFKIPPGWRILSTPTCKFEPGDKGIVPFGATLDSLINRAIDYHLRNGIDPSIFLRMQFRVNSNVIDIPTKWAIDWTKRNLIVENPDMLYTYRLLVTVDQDYLLNLIKDLDGLE